MQAARLLQFDFESKGTCSISLVTDKAYSAPAPLNLTIASRIKTRSSHAILRILLAGPDQQQQRRTEGLLTHKESWATPMPFNAGLELDPMPEGQVQGLLAIEQSDDESSGTLDEGGDTEILPLVEHSYVSAVPPAGLQHDEASPNPSAAQSPGRYQIELEERSKRTSPGPQKPVTERRSPANGEGSLQDNAKEPDQDEADNSAEAGEGADREGHHDTKYLNSTWEIPFLPHDERPLPSKLALREALIPFPAAMDNAEQSLPRNADQGDDEAGAELAAVKLQLAKARRNASIYYTKVGSTAPDCCILLSNDRGPCKLSFSAQHLAEQCRTPVARLTYHLPHQF